jgi:hypothetical protein
MSSRNRLTYDAGAAPTELEALGRHDAAGVTLADGDDGDGAALPEMPAARMSSASLPGAQGLPVAPEAGSGTLARLQSASHALLAEGAWRLRRVGSTGLVGFALLVGAAVLYTANTLPQGNAIAALKAQLARLGPVAQGSAATPQVQVALAGLPTREEASEVLGRIYLEARAAGVDLPRGQYEFFPARDGVAAHYRMTFPLHAAYPQLRNFMDRTLVALPSVAVEGLRIERKNVADESVDAELKLSAFVRDGS